MGSGSSKDGHDQKPVANVNKTSNTVNVSNNHNDRSKSDEHSKLHDRASTHVESKRKQTENRQASDRKIGHGAESDVDDHDDDLNEVLRVPNQQSTDRRPPPIQKQPSPPKQQTTDYPETYAQRKQREQYTLNQQLLLRQKTIFRNPHEWQDENTEESYTGGFDASKFRKANQASLNARDSIFTTSKPGVETYFSHDQQELDDMDITPRQSHQTYEMPVYNASEQDLMASLEEELL